MNEEVKVEQVINRLGEWLHDAEHQAELIDASDRTQVPAVGMLQLAEHLTAVRHDVKLLTKAIRGTEERGESALLAIQAAIDELRSAKSGDGPPVAGNARALVEVLTETEDAISRERRALEAARQHAVQQAARERDEFRQQFDQLFRTQPWWRRAVCRPWYRAFNALYSDHALESNRARFDALLEGHDLLHNRLLRGLRELGILRIECVGRIVDPQCMNVIEVVSDPARPAGLVIEEVRAGYYWNAKVFRFAEVKAIAAQS